MYQIPATKPQVLGYIRVSTIEQADKGISLDTQKSRIKQWCDFRGYNFVKCYEDAGISGSSIWGRIALQEMLEIVQPNQIICVAELSRLSRSTTDAINILGKIKDKKASLVSLTPDIDFSTAIGEMMFTVLMAFHQLERKQIGERVKANMKNLSTQNKLRSRAPYGYIFKGKESAMVRCESQQEVIQRIINEYENKITITNISKGLNRDGLNKTLSDNKTDKTKTQMFYPQTVKVILQNYGKIDPIDRKTILNRYMDARNPR